MDDIAAMAAWTGAVIGIGAYTGTVLGAVVSVRLRGKLSGDR